MNMINGQIVHYISRQSWLKIHLIEWNYKHIFQWKYISYHSSYISSWYRWRAAYGYFQGWIYSEIGIWEQGLRLDKVVSIPGGNISEIQVSFVQKQLPTFQVSGLWEIHGIIIIGVDNIQILPQNRIGVLCEGLEESSIRIYFIRGYKHVLQWRYVSYSSSHAIIFQVDTCGGRHRGEYGYYQGWIYSEIGIWE